MGDLNRSFSTSWKWVENVEKVDALRLSTTTFLGVEGWWRRNLGGDVEVEKMTRSQTDDDLREWARRYGRTVAEGYQRAQPETPPDAFIEVWSRKLATTMPRIAAHENAMVEAFNEQLKTTPWLLRRRGDSQ